jgi:hypothetical protein
LNSGDALPKHQMVGNQLRQGLMMLNNEEIVRELYAAPEGSGNTRGEHFSIRQQEPLRKQTTFSQRVSSNS